MSDVIISDDNHLKTCIHLGRIKAVADSVSELARQGVTDGLFEHTLENLMETINSEVDSARDVLDQVELEKSSIPKEISRDSPKDEKSFRKAKFHFEETWSLIESAKEKVAGQVDDAGIFALVRAAYYQIGQAHEYL